MLASFQQQKPFRMASSANISRTVKTNIFIFHKSSAQRKLRSISKMQLLMADKAKVSEKVMVPC